jgi:flagellar protein FliT
MMDRDQAVGARQAADTSSGLIRQYEEIADASRAMLDAARAGDWEGVGRIEERCRQLIVALKQASSRGKLSAPENRRRLVILRSILDDDAQIRIRSEPWLRDLEDFLAGARPAAKSKR